MLCPGDQALVAAEHALPGLPRLLDPDAFADLLRSCFPDAGVTAVAPRYVRYKRGTSCLVAARATTTAGEFELYARAHDPERGGKIEKALEFRGVRSALGADTAVDREASIVIYVFPNDHVLRSMRELESPERRADFLRRLLDEPDDPDEPERRDAFEGASFETIRYKPERRYVARVRTADDDVAIKLYTEDDYRFARKAVKAFESRAPLRVAETRRRSSGLHAVAVEWLAGTPLNESFTAAGCEATGAALAALHAQTSTRLRRKCRAGPLAEIASSITELVPTLAGAVEDAAAHIDPGLTDEASAGRSAVHGDFSADQVVIDGAVAGVIDFDRAGWGDARLDLGTFRARLIRGVLDGRLAADVADAGFAALMASYRAQADRAVGAVEPFTAAALLRLATEPFRYRHPRWPEQTAAIVAEARRIATTAPSDA